jgi:hypothetical protein
LKPKNYQVHPEKEKCCVRLKMGKGFSYHAKGFSG